MGVWEVVPEDECWKRTGKNAFSARWVDINKGDDKCPNYRSRYVAREIKSQHGCALRDGLFAAMPPLEALRVLVSLTVSKNSTASKAPCKMLFVDISKVYLHADVDDPYVYVELPKAINEDDGLPKVCGRLRKALYGTRIAAKCLEKEYTKTFLERGFERGVTSPCLFKHVSKDMCAFVHGDDLFISGPVNSFASAISRRFED